MILQALVKHYENLAEQGKVAKAGWCRGKISYGIRLSREGEITGVTWLKTEEERGKKKVWLPTPMLVPEMVTRSSGVAANFLCDNSKYLLGIDAEGTSPRVLECFASAKEKHLSILQGVEGMMAETVRLFFEKWNPESAAQCKEIQENWEAITDGGNLIFCMGFDYAQDDLDIKAAWDKSLSMREGTHEGICMVTGKKAEISRIHKTIKGVPGAQSSGASLVSFNAPAFESYGKEQSYNAPVGRYAEFAYTTALNYLLAQREYTFPLGDSIVVFWAESGGQAYQEAFFMSADPKPDNQESIRGIFENLKKHEPILLNETKLEPDQKFYILCLAPNAARLSVRFFYQDSFGNILENLYRHYRRMEIVKPAWEDRDYLGVRHMLYETVNLNSKDKTPISNMAAMVLQAILSGGQYPASLYTDTLIRIRAEQGKVTWGRASILKAYLIQNYKWEKGQAYMGLNEKSDDTAYVLGRLFAVLESIQIDANSGKKQPDKQSNKITIKSTIKDRYFNAACAAPASIFPILIKLKNSHMKKLERETASAKIFYEDLLTKIMEKLEEFPKRLSLEEQGKFDLGYYHQMQKRYEKREEN